jgi:hypothetical protein
MAVEKRKRPMRQKKSDRLTQGINDKAMIEIDFAVAGFDEKSRQMDLKWGVDRLVEVVGVVDPNMAMKFGSAMSKMNKAISDNDPEEVAARVGVCIRGMDAMDRLAMQNNCQPASQDVWEIEADGQVYALMRDGRSWPSIRDKHPNAELVTEREMVLAITMYRNSVVGGMVAETKNAFPSAEVISFKGKEYDDEIPF